MIGSATQKAFESCEGQRNEAAPPYKRYIQQKAYSDPTWRGGTSTPEREQPYPISQQGIMQPQSLSKSSAFCTTAVGAVSSVV